MRCSDARDVRSELERRDDPRPIQSNDEDVPSMTSAVLITNVCADPGPRVSMLTRRAPVCPMSKNPDGASYPLVGSTSSPPPDKSRIDSSSSERGDGLVLRIRMRRASTSESDNTMIEVVVSMPSAVLEGSRSEEHTSALQSRGWSPSPSTDHMRPDSASRTNVRRPRLAVSRSEEH